MDDVLTCSRLISLECIQEALQFAEEIRQRLHGDPTLEQRDFLSSVDGMRESLLIALERCDKLKQTGVS